MALVIPPGIAQASTAVLVAAAGNTAGATRKDRDGSRAESAPERASLPPTEG